MLRYFVLHKPYDVLSQFTKEIPSHKTLKDCFDFPSDVYPVGRLDRDSEGLLILTNDNHLKHRLLEPRFKHKRTYWVQVEGVPTTKALQELAQGVRIRFKKKTYTSLPAKVILLEEGPNIGVRIPPIRVRQKIPTAWLELTLTEGKNRQVRRMCAAVGFPVLRLVRSQLEDLSLQNLPSGEVLAINKEKIYDLLKI